MNYAAMKVVLEHHELADLDPARRRLALRALASQLSAVGTSTTVGELADEIDGFGPLSEVMRDENVTDVLVNGPGEVWVERAGRLERANASFSSDEALRSFIDRLVGRAGRRVDASEPIADAVLPDGSRMHVVLPPVARGGPAVSIRRLPRRRYSLTDLEARSMLTPAQADELREGVGRRATIVVSGGTGSGKTTLVNALLSLVGPDERVVLIEETPELAPSCPHAVCLTCRRNNSAGTGGVDAAELVRAALRMRPDRIVVGEVRGAEALAALAAMSTGHEGSMLTLHARSPGDVVRRMVSLAMQAGSGVSEDSLERQFEAAFDIVVHVGRSEGVRRVTSFVKRRDAASSGRFSPRR